MLVLREPEEWGMGFKSGEIRPLGGDPPISLGFDYGGPWPHLVQE